MDGEPRRRHFLSSLLKREGCEVVAVGSPHEALTKASRDAFRLMLISINSLGLDELDLIEKIQKIQRDMASAFIIQVDIPQYRRSNQSVTWPGFSDSPNNGYHNILWERLGELYSDELRKEEQNYVTREELDRFKRRMEYFVKSFSHFLIAYNALIAEEKTKR